MWPAAANRTGCAGLVGGSSWPIREATRWNDAEKSVARALLKERVSLRGIARVLKVSPSQVLRFFEAEAEDLPDDLNFDPTRAET